MDITNFYSTYYQSFNSDYFMCKVLISFRGFNAFMTH